MQPNPILHRPRTGRTLTAAGLVAQLVGVGTQALWHTLFATRTNGMLTESRTFWIDHILSNTGVACLLVGSVLLHRRHPTTATRVVLIGSGCQVLGALLDGYAHLRGGEDPAAFALIGLGFLLATGGAVASWRRGGGGGSPDATAA